MALGTSAGRAGLDGSSDVGVGIAKSRSPAGAGPDGSSDVGVAKSRSPAGAQGAGPSGVLPEDFYARPVLEVAHDLIGCIVEHRGISGKIVETEAYHESEPACHAFVGVTPRTRTLFGEPGVAYVYRSYGIHALLNAVCEPAGVGAAVLIRALEPLDGIDEMRLRRDPAGRGHRRGGERAPLRDRDLCSGPGKLTQALGVELSENGSSLLDGPVAIRSASLNAERLRVVSGTRIGIAKAVDLRWRFCAATSAHLSRPG